MNNHKHLWLYLAQFFFEREICQTWVVQKIKTQILSSKAFFPRKIVTLWENLEKYGTAGQAACRVTKYVIVITFPLHQWLHEHAWMLHIRQNASLVLSFEDITPSPLPLLQRFHGKVYRLTELFTFLAGWWEKSVFWIAVIIMSIIVAINGRIL
jgi:hypothetical protein